MKRLTSTGLVLLLAIAGVQEGEAQRDYVLGFRGNLGSEVPRGEPAELFQGNVRGEFSVLFAPQRIWPVYFGLGGAWVSYPIQPGWAEEDQWNHVGLHFLLGLSGKDALDLPLYGEVRLINRRLRPIHRRFWDIDSDDPIKERPYVERSGWAGEALLGLELPMSRSVAFDMGVRITDFTPEPAGFLGPEGLKSIRDGWSYGFQLGLQWWPSAPPPPKGNLIGRPWHRGSLGLAVGEALLGNFIPWFGAEYLTQWKDISRISPTTWRYNLQTGPVWDDNHFHINWILHPWQGHFYYVAGRSNGYNYWGSFLLTTLGSATWECCGESHSASASDLVTTTLGGAVLGETFYRWGTLMLDRPGRRWAWLAGLLTPTRATTRAVLRRPRKPQPADRYRWEIPMHQSGALALGYHRSNPSGASGAFLELRYTYEDLGEIRRGSRPFDHFGAAIELKQGGKGLLERVQVTGLLWPAFAVGPSDRRFLGLVQQSFDYTNKSAFEFGMQSVGATLAGVFGSPAGNSLTLFGGAHGGFGGVQSEWAHLGKPHDLREQERDREYDFTRGLGGTLGIEASVWKARMSGYLRQDWSRAVDGSNRIVWERELQEYPAGHITKQWGVSLEFYPWGGTKPGLGFDMDAYKRNSWYRNPNLAAAAMFERQWRFYLSWNTQRRPRSLFIF